MVDDSSNDRGICEETDSGQESIAIIGWSGRFPGADDVESFWENIRAGVESIDFYSEEELRQAGIPESSLRDPNFVRASAKIKDAEMFDAEFFGFTPRESILMDPQHRVFLESAWHALENAGIDTKRCASTIGVFAGTNPDGYMYAHFNHKEFTQASAIEKRLSSDNSFFTTRVAYMLNLKGPALTIETACSTSLVAVVVACQQLMTYQCDVALAGAATVHEFRKSGYRFQPYGILSPDGHCRAFDEEAKGTIGGEGVATVVLKRLEDALAEGDTIHAVIRGWALNNDGNAKVGFTAPSVEGQAEAIEMAQTLAGVTADTIGYLEAHGTGTELGDPIEVAALTQAFSATTTKTNFCSLGSVKTNIGHLDAAAGIAGMVKAALALKNKQKPPLVHFRKLNPKIQLGASPFYIDTRLESWERQATPRRAGVSSFGIGGTNAHVILEESSDSQNTGPSRNHQLLLVSARSESRCDQALENLADWLENHNDQALADVAYTLQTGRRQFDVSAICVAKNNADTIVALRQAIAGHGSKERRSAEPVGIAFMFPGQGNQYVNMGLELYRSEPVFCEIVDQCSDILRAEFEYDLRSIIYPSPNQDDNMVAEAMTRTEYAQPALFVVEYAMARLLMTWGIQAQAFIGHSIGEYVAATLAGVFRLEDALRLVAHRGRLMQSASPGSMAAIPLSSEELTARLPENLSIAVINEPGMCVVAGDLQSVKDFVESCEQENLRCHLLRTSHAFHSAMMDEILDEFFRLVGAVNLAVPQIPFVSNLTGDWITERQAVDPQYWVNHIRQAVLFNDGLKTLLQNPSRLLYEVGPGNSLSSIAQRHPARSATQKVVTSMRHPLDTRDDLAVLLESLGMTWQSGVEIDWAAFYQNERRKKVPLPGYPFARTPYWLNRSDEQKQNENLHDEGYTKIADIDDWFYVTSWLRQPATSDIVRSDYFDPEKVQRENIVSKNWLIFDNQSDLSRQIVEHLRHGGDRVTTIKLGSSYRAETKQSYTVSNSEQDFIDLAEDLVHGSRDIDGIVYLWASQSTIFENDVQNVSAEIELSFYVPLILLKAANRLYEKQPKQSPLSIYFVTQGIQQVTGSEDIHPVKSLILGINKVCTQEMPYLRARSIDLEGRPLNSTRPSVEQNADYILSELFQPGNADDRSTEIAYRGPYRWLKTIEPMQVKPQSAGEEQLRLSAGSLRRNGVYLITGGLGGIGRALSEYLADGFQASLVLTGRKTLPDRNKWDEWMVRHDHADAVSQTIDFIRMLEAKGAKVMAASCDVTDFDEMEAVIEAATTRFGNINGVIHTAGVPAGGLIQLKDRQSAAEILAPKVQGALVLDALFRNRSLDFMVFCSSLAAILGGVGQVDYTAANIFLDAFAVLRQQRGLKTISINWDTWSETGMATEAEMPAQFRARLQKSLDAGIRSDEGVDVFARILNQMYPQIVVSTRTIEHRMRHSESRLLTKIDDENADQRPVDSKEGDEQSSDSPVESTPGNYIAPRNETESILCDIWQEMFGVGRIGIEDSFFELGGHSLLAVQILSRINETANTNLSLKDFFDAVTISGLAEKLSHQESYRVENDAQKSTSDIVDALSDEEVAHLLAKKIAELDVQ